MTYIDAEQAYGLLLKYVPSLVVNPDEVIIKNPNITPPDLEEKLAIIQAERWLFNGVYLVNNRSPGHKRPFLGRGPSLVHFFHRNGLESNHVGMWVEHHSEPSVNSLYAKAMIFQPELPGRLQRIHLLELKKYSIRTTG